MKEPTAEPIVLTPEQRAALGKIYQLILIWRRQRLQRESEASAKELEQPAPAPTDTESEA